MKVIIVLIIGTLIFLGLRILRLGLKYLQNRYHKLAVLGNIMVVFESLVWIIYIFQSGSYLFRDKFFYQYLVYILILVLALFFTWYLLKDVFAGIIFKARHSLKPGTYIRAGNHSGLLKSYNITSLKLIGDDGQTADIPYSRIINEVYSEKGFPGIAEEHRLHIKAGKTLGRARAEELIRTAVLNSPWSSLKEEPVVRLLNEDDKGYLFEVKLYTQRKLRHLKLLEELLDTIPDLHLPSP